MFWNKNEGKKERENNNYILFTNFTKKKTFYLSNN